MSEKISLDSSVSGSCIPAGSLHGCLHKNRTIHRIRVETEAIRHPKNQLTC